MVIRRMHVNSAYHSLNFAICCIVDVYVSRRIIRSVLSRWGLLLFMQCAHQALYPPTHDPKTQYISFSFVHLHTCVHILRVSTCLLGCALEVSDRERESYSVNYGCKHLS